MSYEEMWRQATELHNHRKTEIPSHDELVNMLYEYYFNLNAIVVDIHDFMNPTVVCPEEDACEKCQNLEKNRRRMFKSINEILMELLMNQKSNKTWNGQTFEERKK